MGFVSTALFVFVVYGLVFGICCGWLAREKGRSVSNWFITGFLLGIIGLLLIAFAPVQTVENSSQGEARNAPLSLSALAKALVGAYAVFFGFQWLTPVFYELAGRDLLALIVLGQTQFVVAVITAVKIYSFSSR